MNTVRQYIKQFLNESKKSESEEMWIWVDQNTTSLNIYDSEEEAKEGANDIFLRDYPDKLLFNVVKTDNIQDADFYYWHSYVPSLPYKFKSYDDRLLHDGSSFAYLAEEEHENMEKAETLVNYALRNNIDPKVLIGLKDIDILKTDSYPDSYLYERLRDEPSWINNPYLPLMISKLSKN